MQFKEISDLPRSQVAGYGEHQKRAFLEAFNAAEKEGNDEQQAFSVAHRAAEKAAQSENTKP